MIFFYLAVFILVILICYLGGIYFKNRSKYTLILLSISVIALVFIGFTKYAIFNVMGAP